MKHVKIQLIYGAICFFLSLIIGFISRVNVTTIVLRSVLFFSLGFIAMFLLLMFVEALVPQFRKQLSVLSRDDQDAGESSRAEAEAQREKDSSSVSDETIMHPTDFSVSELPRDDTTLYVDGKDSDAALHELQRGRQEPQDHAVNGERKIVISDAGAGAGTGIDTGAGESSAARPQRIKPLTLSSGMEEDADAHAQEPSPHPPGARMEQQTGPGGPAGVSGVSGVSSTSGVSGAGGAPAFNRNSADPAPSDPIEMAKNIHDGVRERTLVVDGGNQHETKEQRYDKIDMYNNARGEGFGMSDAPSPISSEEGSRSAMKAEVEKTKSQYREDQKKFTVSLKNLISKNGEKK